MVAVEPDGEGEEQHRDRHEVGAAQGEEERSDRRIRHQYLGHGADHSIGQQRHPQQDGRGVAAAAPDDEGPEQGGQGGRQVVDQAKTIQGRVWPGRLRPRHDKVV